jgi:hypothetical protein
LPIIAQQLVRLDSTELMGSVDSVMEAAVSNPLYTGIAVLCILGFGSLLFRNRQI